MKKFSLKRLGEIIIAVITTIITTLTTTGCMG